MYLLYVTLKFMETVVKIQLRIKSSPISTNNAYYSRNKAFTDKARQWRANFLIQLQSDYNQNQIKKVRDVFDPKKHMLRTVFTWRQPKETLITNSGTLSLRSMDVDNVLKIPTDCVFDSKYNCRWLSLRKGGEKKLYSDIESLFNMDLNDKYIFDTRSIKIPSEDDSFHCSVDIEVVNLFT